MKAVKTYNGILAEEIFCVGSSEYLRTKKAKGLKRCFEECYETMGKLDAKQVVKEAWYVYLVQCVERVIFEDCGCSLDFVPENFAKITFDGPGGYKAFIDFIDCLAGESVDCIYALNEDTPEMVQAGMYDVANDWFKYQKKEKKGKK